MSSVVSLFVDRFSCASQNLILIIKATKFVYGCLGFLNPKKLHEEEVIPWSDMFKNLRTKTGRLCTSALGVPQRKNSVRFPEGVLCHTGFWCLSSSFLCWDLASFTGFPGKLNMPPGGETIIQYNTVSIWIRNSIVVLSVIMISEVVKEGCWSTVLCVPARFNAGFS